jgi:hypothetical protein
MLIVEDGIGKTDSESYCTVAFATTYFANRGNAAWAALASDTIRENYLRLSTDFMEQRYILSWKGFKKTSVQALSWPRSFVYGIPVLYGDNNLPYPQLISSTIVPTEVQRACAELALKASTYTDGLLPDLTDVITEETIGPITTKYDKRSPVSPLYKAIDAMLAVYLKDGGMDSASRTVQRA